jgi:hypothetical protein
MMKRYYIDNLEIEIDTDKTAEYYKNVNIDSLLTCCSYCKNYYYGIRKVGISLLKFFNEFCIIPEMAANVSELQRINEKVHLYNPTYLVIGRILRSPDEDYVSNEGNYETINLQELVGEVDISFKEELCLPPGVKLCSDPLLQIDIFCEVPWVIEESH